MNIEYYLKLRHEPKYSTLSWTLDFRHTSDLGTLSPNADQSCCLLCVSFTFVLNDTLSLTVFVDDSVGLWQVMPHPERKDWTRILYSTKIKLLPWIPEFAVRSFTTQALTEVKYLA